LILSTFIAGTLLIIFMQYNSAKNINNLMMGNRRLLNELKAANQLRELDRDLLAAETRINRTVATGDTSRLKEVDEQLTEASGLINSLRATSIEDSSLRNLERLSALANEKMTLKARILDSFRQNGTLTPEDFQVITQHRRMLFNEVNVASRSIYETRQHLLDSLSTFTNNSGRQAQRWNGVMILMVLISEAVLFWYIISRIHRQNQLIRQLDASEKKVREVSRIKENFMANISHEIRTPMNAILGFTNLLKARNRDPEVAEFIDAIRQSGENLLVLINDLLDLSKIEAGMMRIESVPFSLRELLHSVQTMFAEKMNEKGLRFSVAIDETIPDSVTGDPTRLTQILANMIGNALKFTTEGSVSIEVTNKSLDGNRIRIGFVIRDTGIGIAREKLSEIFDRFQQAEDSITREYGGTGLGLSIVKDLVLLQQGDIAVESEPGKGTVFSFTLPYHLGAAQPMAPASPEEAASDYLDLRHIRILVAEDNKMNQSLLRHLLTARKLSFDIVNNGVEAIGKLQAGHYDLVLMDVQMPVMDGYTATQQIRMKLKLDIPIIAMTAHAFAGEREKSLQFGMNEYIAKPIDQRELFRLIGRFTRAQYQFIDLEYMRSISEGNREYEKSVTEQFIEAIPLDINMLQTAQHAGDLATIRQTAHNMRSDVAIMGILDKLRTWLDVLEYEPFETGKFQQAISAVKSICEQALPEARNFYTSF
jgi:signal transduction histidine kinase/CheY-like chemotaxis protein